MKGNQGEFQPFFIAFLVLLLHGIAVFADAEIPCNQTCGSRTVKYPFGFSSACPYMLDSDCSENGDVYLEGFKVLNFTNSSVIIRPWQSKGNNSRCYKVKDIPSIFKQRFVLTNRNVLLLENCTRFDCKFNITNLGSGGSKYYDDRKNCSSGSGLISCLSKTDGHGLSWKDLEASACKYFLTSLISHTDASNGYISLDVNELDLGWWVNGSCLPNSCSSNANCSQFQNPNNDEWVHICYCNDGFEGDGFSQGVGCKNVSGCKASGNLSQKCGKHSKVVLLTCSVIGGSATAVGFFLLYCCYQRYRHALKTRRSREWLMFAQHGDPLNIAVYTYKEMEIATKGFSDKERLGTGGFGTVYAGMLPGKSIVAVKKIRHGDTQGMEQVLNEIRLLSSVNHPNLVRLLGCCLEKREPILVYEFMHNGTLSQHLQKERGEGISWGTRVTIASETAHALAYLHSAINPPIYHRDVKSSNILLDYGFSAKVADFGLSKLVLTEGSHISTAPQGTLGYLDPQYHENFHLTDKSDVYSFGVVLVEIITALKVVDFSRDGSEINLAILAVKKIGGGCIDDIVDPFLEVGKNLQIRTTIHRVAELAFRCLSFDQDARPSMVEVAQALDLIAYDNSSLDSIDSTSTDIDI